MGWYTIFMLVALPILGGGWIAYAIWNHKIRQEEKTGPKVVSERLSKTRSDLSNWAQKMKEHKSPREQALERRRQLEAERLRKEQQSQQDSND
ncbi:MAG: hypothetical protein JW720_04430 [Sedimentisphaerales bacterium]|nr:hypothetical protein [Sedimentisphaerales bacterium]